MNNKIIKPIPLQPGEKAYQGAFNPICDGLIHRWIKRDYLDKPCCCGQRTRRYDSDNDPALKGFFDNE